MDGTKYDFNRFLPPFKFVEKIYNYESTPDEAIDDQEKLGKSITRLKNYKVKYKKKNRREKNKVLESVVKLFRVREDIIVFFEKEIFHLKVTYLKQKKMNQEMNQKKR